MIKNLKVFNLSIIALSILLPFNSSAGTNLTNIALFNRCYAQITGLRVAPENMLARQVAAGTMPAITACLQVLNKGILNGNGNTTIANTADPEALAVFRNMHNLHSSWFSIKDFTDIDSENQFWTDGTKDLWDNSTPALYITKALFDVNPSYLGTLSGNAIYTPVRATMNPLTGARSNLTADIFAFTTPFQFAPRGSLQGIRSVSPATANFSILEGGDIPVLRTGSVPLFGSVGGGLLGNYSYALLNVLQDQKFVSNGGTQMPRKWGRAVFHDLLCRDLPVVRNSDATPFVVSTSTVPFRTTSSCTSCHVSMDRISSVVRNVSYTTFGNQKKTAGQRGAIFVNFPQTSMGAQPGWPAEPDASYSKRSPSGNLFYRNYLGNLVDVAVSGPSDLGTQIASQDDFYICAAKRYYTHFTGISVDTGDISDPQRRALSSTALAHRNEVINLGKSLKQHNNLRQLISDIFNLPQYRRSDSAL